MAKNVKTDIAGQTDDAFDKGFIGIVRVPENHDVAAFDVSPAKTFDVVVNEFIDDQAFAVVKLRHHRCAFDDDGLGDKNQKQKKNRQHEHDISQKLKTFAPDAVARRDFYLMNFDITVVFDADSSERRLFFSGKIEHN